MDDVSTNSISATEFQLDNSAFRIYNDASNLIFEDPSAGVYTLRRLITSNYYAGDNIEITQDSSIRVVDSPSFDGSISADNFKFDNGNHTLIIGSSTNISGSSFTTIIGSGAGGNTTDNRIRHATLTGDTSIYFSNLEAGGGLKMWMTGDYAIEFPTSVTNIEGSYDGTGNNMIVFYCIDASSGSETVTSQIFSGL